MYKVSIYTRNGRDEFQVTLDINTREEAELEAQSICDAESTPSRYEIWD